MFLMQMIELGGFGRVRLGFLEFILFSPLEVFGRLDLIVVNFVDFTQLGHFNLVQIKFAPLENGRMKSLMGMYIDSALRKNRPQ